MQSTAKSQKQRHRVQQQRRRAQVIKSLWRFVCMSGILVGVGWVVSQADWKISRAEQIQIQGNQYLSDKTIRSMLAIPYPQMIMELAPEDLATKLMTKGSVLGAKIDRGLLPPRLIVQIQDLPPVAGILQDQGNQADMFVDERGRQQPLSSYQASILPLLPKLKLQLSTTGICPNWQQLYPTIQTSPVAVGIIDCRSPHNIFLQTEIGKVRLGDNRDQAHLTNQIQQLDRLRNWRKDTDPAQVDYLDLENPDSPRFKFKPVDDTTKKSDSTAK